jgi:F-type H+-transporting ATPase subunit epsilon
MHLTILSPEREIFTGAVKSVKVPGTNGAFEMLENHAPIVAALARGEVRIIQANGERTTFQITGGFVEMLQNEVALLVSGTETSSEK